MSSLSKLLSSAIEIFECDEASGNLVGRLGNYTLTQDGTIGTTTGIRDGARQWSDANISNRRFSAAGFTHNTLKNGGAATAPWFMSLWFRLDSFAHTFAFRRILATTITANEGLWALELQGAAEPDTIRMRCRTSSATNDGASVAGAIGEDDWHLIIAGYNGSGAYFLTCNTGTAPLWSSVASSPTGIVPNATALATQVVIGGYAGSGDTLRAATMDQVGFYPGEVGDYGTEQDVLDELYGSGAGVDWDAVAAAGGRTLVPASGLALGLGL